MRGTWWARRRYGVTLLEALIACTIVILVLLSLLGAIAFGLEGTRHAAGHQQGVYYARELLELIREKRYAYLPRQQASLTLVGFSDLEDDRIPLNDPPFQDNFPSQSGYTRRIVTEPMSPNPADHRSKVYRIEVTVFWRVKGRESSFRIEGLSRELI